VYRIAYKRVICISSLADYQSIPNKIDWIKARLGIDWMKRVLVVPDKTLLQADIMVDLGTQDTKTLLYSPKETPDKAQKQGKKKSKQKQDEEDIEPKESVIEVKSTRVPVWKMHVVHDQPWNKQWQGKRITDWKNWKQVFELDVVPATETEDLKDMVYFHHGSEGNKVD
jgi:hypothetical protein